MRNRALLLTALVIAPAALSAQVRLPRGGRGAPPTAAPLPPEAPIVAKALAYKRSRWSGEAYSLISTFQVPDGSGVTSYTSFGTGTRADYRYSEHFSVTVDVTASALGSPAISESGELGTRFRPGSLEQRLRTYVDARAQFVHCTTHRIFRRPAGRSSAASARTVNSLPASDIAGASGA